MPLQHTQQLAQVPFNIKKKTRYEAPSLDPVDLTRLFHLFEDFERSLDRLALSHITKPLLDMREVIHVVLVLAERVTNQGLPHDESDIGIGILITHKPRSVRIAPAILLFLLRQMPLQDARHAINFLSIALNNARHGLGMVSLEPHNLPVIRSLARDLEVEPLLRVVGLWRPGRETEAVLRVVALDEVLEDGAGFPEGDVRVGVVDGGDAAVGVDGEVGGRFAAREVDGVDLVGEAEFAE